MNIFKRILSYYQIPSPAENSETDMNRLKRIRLISFLTATFGYGIYYVCRLSMNVIRKPMVEDGIFTETEIGVIGSCLFFTYAIGKLCNGFIADRANVKRLMSTGLLISALINLALGFTNSFMLFAILWGVNGFFQSMGATSGVVSLTRWFDSSNRGTYYGFWSASHNLGEAITFISIAILATQFGWRYALIGAGLIGIAYFFMMQWGMKDTPQRYGYLLDQHHTTKEKTPDFNKSQKAVLRNPAIWILALGSAFMYISRYAVNSWGVFYLETMKGYSTLDASFIISISSVCGIVGTISSRLISDKLFKGSRNIPAFIFGLINVVALCLFLLVPGVHFLIDVFAMVLFGLGIGVLICFLGGLMAVDLAPKNASGAALGVVGVASYIGAGIQDIMSGWLIEGNKHIVNGSEVYDFTYINYFWIGAALLSVMLTLLVWNAKPSDN
ncbi:transporter, major facilitator family protein [Segatella baroniae F0067]|uniref:Transporter, major facilitator family protein n=1 Tax=Segatella baroniae F0067 TaxID=1115809 RepID=U2P6L0_9BACT|nr:MFS transporter [Segatella baroniae]ERK39791.1 transporter, major facilitator family protein [Segatella baroniae F0067]